MPRRQIIAKMLKSLPSTFRANRGIIYNSCYEWIVRGILVEGTAYKATWHVHDFTFPLFRTHYFVHISYSERIVRDPVTRKYWYDGTDNTIASDALDAVQRHGLIEEIVSPCSPAQFLQRWRRHEGGPIETFDWACAAGLCGDVEAAKQGLETAIKRRDRRARMFGPPGYHDALGRDVEARLRALAEGPEAFRANLGQAAAAAAAFHGFAPPFRDSPAGA